MSDTNKQENTSHSLKDDIKDLTSGGLALVDDGLKVAQEGVELWASIKTLNIVGIAKNGYEFFNEVGGLLSNTMESLTKAGPILENIKNDVVNSQDLKEINKELGDVSQQWNKLSDSFEKKGVFGAVPELLNLVGEVGDLVGSVAKGVGDLVSEIGNGIIDGISGSTVSKEVKDKADEVGKVVKDGMEVVDKGIKEVENAKQYVEEKVNVLKDVSKSVAGGLSDVDKAKAKIQENNKEQSGPNV